MSWEEEADHTGVAPKHRDAALKAQASKANNTPMQKKEEQIGVSKRIVGRKPRNYWTHENILKELKNVINQVGHFPTQEELITMGRRNLVELITNNGGSNEFREMLGYELPQKPNGYWNYNNTLTELKNVIVQIGHFPTQKELSEMKRGYLVGAIRKNGGLDKFRKVLGVEYSRKPEGYWTDDTIVSELITIIDEINHFPTQKELDKLGKSRLASQIQLKGGTVKFRKLLKAEIIRRPKKYWTFDVTLNELKSITTRIGHFPSYNELQKLKRRGLVGAIRAHGGSGKFRESLGFDSLQKPHGYWTEDRIIKELNTIRDELNHFPTLHELSEIGKTDLLGCITKKGGLIKYQEKMGCASLSKKYRAESAAYSSRRGRNTETMVKQILIDWCKQNGYPKPIYNKQLAPSNVIEFVCATGKNIGIDVTNTKDKSGDSISRKYLRKDYHKYVDELWIVVFSNAFTEADYKKFNEESPDNVRVMSIDTFLEELDISTDEHLHSKIQNYKNCTFRTKDEFIKKHLNKSLDDYTWLGSKGLL